MRSRRRRPAPSTCRPRRACRTRPTGGPARPQARSRFRQVRRASRRSPGRGRSSWALPAPRRARAGGRPADPV
ncbi:hypothetical protein FV233_00175 [Methylobacterium sp. WL7]|nr:hypothetical protein FV233_00175 [Methylobacterium sp. WL7]